MQILQAAQQGDQQAAQIVQQAQAVMQDPQQQQQIVQAAQQGDQSAMAIIAVMMAAQQAQSAKFGAKLSYIQRLRGVCPEGTEMQFFKQGGQVCKKCVKKVKMKEGGETPQNPVDAFKCGRKMKRKAACGTKVKMDQKGSKVTPKTETNTRTYSGWNPPPAVSITQRITHHPKGSGLDPDTTYIRTENYPESPKDYVETGSVKHGPNKRRTKTGDYDRIRKEYKSMN